MRLKVGDLIKLPSRNYHPFHRDDDVVWWANRPALVVRLVRTNELPHVGVMMVWDRKLKVVMFPGSALENCEVFK